ncbi:MAG TPA: hypothetical protein VFD41_14620 [Actinomycetales bacterium]|nr:hypothetical protein [Actinomycetales bacterium]
MSRRRATFAVAVVGWVIAVAVVGWLSWTAIDAAGRQVVAPVVPSTQAGGTPTPSAPTTTAPTTTAPTTTGPTTTGPTTTGPAPQERTFSTRGGSSAVSCSGDALTVTYATPANGWRVDSERESPSSARVEFRRDHDRVRLELTCEGGQPSGVVEEDGDSSGPGG